MLNVNISPSPSVLFFSFRSWTIRRSCKQVSNGDIFVFGGKNIDWLKLGRFLSKSVNFASRISVSGKNELKPERCLVKFVRIGSFSNKTETDSYDLASESAETEIENRESVSGKNKMFTCKARLGMSPALMLRSYSRRACHLFKININNLIFITIIKEKYS